MNDTSIASGPHGTDAMAPRLTPASIEAIVLREAYHVFPGTTLTVCCLTLRNGFNVTGESACVSQAVFNAAKGEELARENAVRKVWPLEGYLLRQMLHVAALEGSLAQQVLQTLQGENITEQGRVALRDAFERGDEARVRRLLSNRMMIDPSDQLTNAELLGKGAKQPWDVVPVSDANDGAAAAALNEHHRKS
jgi:hypothetical protein